LFSIKRTLVILSLVLYVEQSSFADDNLILFPFRVGQITSRTGEVELARIYGKSNLSRRIRPWDDGGYGCATVIFEGTEREVYIFWREDSHEYSAGKSAKEREKCNNAVPRKTPASVYIATNFEKTPPNQPTFWKTPDEVFVGMSLLKLERINDAPIEFEASPSCFDGGIINWNQGKLEKAKDLFNYSRISYPFDEQERLQKLGRVYSKDLSDSLKEKIFLANIDFSFPQSDQ